MYRRTKQAIAMFHSRSRACQPFWRYQCILDGEYSFPSKGAANRKCKLEERKVAIEMEYLLNLLTWNHSDGQYTKLECLHSEQEVHEVSLAHYAKLRHSQSYFLPEMVLLVATALVADWCTHDIRVMYQCNQCKTLGILKFSKENVASHVPVKLPLWLCVSVILDYLNFECQYTDANHIYSISISNTNLQNYGFNSIIRNSINIGNTVPRSLQGLILMAAQSKIMEKCYLCHICW